MRVIIQSEASECALASLAMVCSAHGLQVDLADLRRRFAVSIKGATMQQLVQHADGLNFSSRPLRLELDELQQLQLPCILHWGLNHFVVLAKVRKKTHLGLRPCCG
jgi:ATP-binding cassette subfamily B protein RaxB